MWRQHEPKEGIHLKRERERERKREREREREGEIKDLWEIYLGRTGCERESWRIREVSNEK